MTLASGTFELADLSDAILQPLATVWFDGWHDAHDAIVPEALTRLRTRDDFVHRLQTAKFFMRVAVRGDDVLGFVAVVDSQLDQLYVAKTARGTGVAQALMKAAEDHLRASGHKTAWLSCGIGNRRAALFYEKAGWAPAGEETVALETTNGPFSLKVWRFEKAF